MWLYFKYDPANIFFPHCAEQFGQNLMGFALSYLRFELKSSIVKTRLSTISSVIWVSMNLRDSNTVDTTPVILF